MPDQTSLDAEPAADRAPRALRRKQVLDAATRCFARRGFHSASIAQIGAEAGMSVGHIYRYFTNKEAIIAGIVRRNVDEARDVINQVEQAQDGAIQDAMIACADRGVEKALDPERATLMIEVKAESARNPKLAEILHAADAEMRGHLRAMLRRASPGDWTDHDIEMRAEMLALAFEGLPLRVISNPDLDRPAVIEMMRLLITAILR